MWAHIELSVFILKLEESPLDYLPGLALPDVGFGTAGVGAATTGLAGGAGEGRATDSGQNGGGGGATVDRGATTGGGVPAGSVGVDIAIATAALPSVTHQSRRVMAEAEGGSHVMIVRRRATK